MHVLSVCRARPDGKFVGDGTDEGGRFRSRQEERRIVRLRGMLLISLTTVGAWMLADSASALDLGLASTPLPIPPMPAVGPVVVATHGLVPQIGAHASASSRGIGVDVTVPSVGAVSVGPGAPGSVQLWLGSGGAPAARPRAPAPGEPVPVPTSPRSSSAVRSPAPRAPSSSSTSTRAAPARAASVPDAHAVQSAAIEETPGTVSASLRRPVPDGTWTLLRALASTHGLLLGLAMLLLVARCALGGMLRDAIRNARVVGSV
jgi:hypothetical protein